MPDLKGQHLASPPTLADGATSPIQLDDHGRIQVAIGAGGGGDASAANQATQITQETATAGSTATIAGAVSGGKVLTTETSAAAAKADLDALFAAIAALGVAAAKALQVGGIDPSGHVQALLLDGTNRLRANDEPFNDLVPVTLDDANDLPGGVSRGLRFTATGVVKVTTSAGNARTITITDTGLLQLAVRRVWSTGTDAGMVGKVEAGY